MRNLLDQVFLGYAFSMPEVESAVRNAADSLADVIVAKDEIFGSHILDKILGQMAKATVCLFDLTGHNINVALELGLAMGARKSYRLLYNPESTANPPGSRDFFSDLKGWDHLRYTSFADLEEKLSLALPKILEHARTSGVRPIVTPSERENVASPFASYIDDAFSIMTRAFLVPTYVCRFYLTVHPQRFVPNRLALDDLPEIFDGVMVRARSARFPMVSPLDGEPRHLRDGIQVDADFVGASNTRYREFYRFLENGAFMFERVLPSDIELGGGYVNGDRTIGYLQLINTVTQMGWLAANLARLYSEDCEARVRIAGLAHHTLVDDTGRNVLLKPYAPPIEDDISVTWSGSPEDFSEKAESWARDFVKKALRLLNAPDISAQVIERWQLDLR